MAKQTPSKKPTAGKSAPRTRKAGAAGASAKSKAAKAKPKAVAKSPAGAKVGSGGRPKPAKNRPAASSKAIARPAKKRQQPVASLPEDEPIKFEPCRLTPAELEEFRQMLLAKRQQLIGDVAHLEDEAIRSRQHGESGSSSMPIHMADIGSDTWEQELTLGLIENERGLLREIDEALDRIKNGTFGVCLGTGKPITKARLRAKPWAKYCIEYARKRELGLA